MSTSYGIPPAFFRPAIPSARVRFILFLAFVLVGGAASTARAQRQIVTLDESGFGRTVPLGVGDTLEIRLKADAGNTYYWRVAENDPAVLRPVSPLGAPDGSGSQILRFKAIAPGGGRLSLLYQEPGKPGVRPLDTFQVRVLINQGGKAKKVVVRDADNGGQVTLNRGDSLIVRLTTGAGTGFNWGIASNNPYVLKPVSSETIPPANGMPGGRAEQVMHFDAVGLGGETLILLYKRPMSGGSYTFGATNFNLNVWVVPAVASPVPVGGMTLWDNDSGRHVPVRLGDTITIRLTSNPSTGYSWNLAGGGTPPILQLQGTPRTEQTGGNVVGAPSTQVYRFRVVSAGQGVLRLLYQRPWETGVQAARKWEVILTATP